MEPFQCARIDASENQGVAEMNRSLEVNQSLTSGRRLFYTFNEYAFDYIYDIEPNGELLRGLRDKGVDLFSFIGRTFVQDEPEKNYPFLREIENIALLNITSYNDWWTRTIKKKERQSVKKAEKTGVVIRKTEICEDFIKGVQRIYNETPFREGRRYSGYGLSLEHLRKKFQSVGDSDILGAYFNEELIGLLWITYGDRAAMFRSFVSFIKHRNKCPNNALIAGAVRCCSERAIHFLVYGDKFGFLPSLDRFRLHQGFRKFPLPRYFVPLSKKGQVAITLGVHRTIEYSLPRLTQRALLPLYNLGSKLMPAAVWWKFGGE